MTEEKNMFEILRGKIECLEDIRYKMTCVDNVLNMTCNAIHYMPEKAEDFVAGIPVCTYMLDNIWQNLDDMREDIRQTLCNFEQMAQYK